MPSYAATNSPRAQSVRSSAIAALILAGFAVFLRFVTRGYMLRCFGREDWTIGSALLFSVGNTHIATLSAEDIENFIKGAYYTIIAYNTSLTLTKISILFLFLRILKTDGRRYIYAVFVVVVVYGLWSIVSSIVWCVPIHAFWDVTVTDAKCLPQKPIWFTNAALNMLTDFAIFVIPIPALSTLRLGYKKKMGLMAVFFLGFFVCIVSATRLHPLYVAAISSDPTWDNVGVAVWSSIELNCAIICACLPTLRPLISRLFPRTFSTNEDIDIEYLQQSSVGGDNTRSLQESTDQGRGINHDSVPTQQESNRSWWKLPKVRGDSVVTV